MKGTTKLYLLLSAVYFLFIIEKNYASPQSPDYLIFQGDTLPIYNLILEEYFQIIEKKDKGSLFGLKFREGASFNCWRGYQAYYSIENDRLYLNHIVDCGERKIDTHASNQKIRSLFGNEVKNGKVFLHWFTGEFTIPDGDLLRWDGVFHKSFEYETLIKVTKGKIKNIYKIENYIDDPGRINRRYKDTISTLLFKELEKNYRNADNPIDCSERFTATISKNGEIEKIVLTNYRQNEISEYFEKEEILNCFRTIKFSLRDLKFDIIKANGRPVEEEVTFGIWLNDDGTLENWTD